MTIQEGDLRKEKFLDNLNNLTEPKPEIGMLKISYKGKLILVYNNIPGQAGSVRIIGNLVRSGKLDFAACQKALLIYEPFIEEAKEFPGKHPAIDVMLAMKNDDLLQVEVINFDNSLFQNENPDPEKIKQLFASGKVKLVEEVVDFNITAGELKFGSNRYRVQKHLLNSIKCLSDDQ